MTMPLKWFETVMGYSAEGSEYEYYLSGAMVSSGLKMMNEAANRVGGLIHPTLCIEIHYRFKIRGAISRIWEQKWYSDPGFDPRAFCEDVESGRVSLDPEKWIELSAW
jgi:hypothetical protein